MCVCVCVLETFIYFIMLVHIITYHMFKFEWLDNVLDMSVLHIQDKKVCTDPG